MATVITWALILVAMFVSGALVANVCDDRHAARKARERREREAQALDVEEEPAEDTAA